MLTEFCENSKVVSSNLSMMKSIVAALSSTFPITLICYFKSGFSNLICLLKFTAVNL